MKIKHPQYLLTAVKPEQYPEKALPAVAFLGRSNVGKSSLINTLTNRKKLARTSSQPGKTSVGIWWIYRGMDSPKFLARNETIGGE